VVSLRTDDLDRARRMSPAEKLVLAFDLMAAGIELRRAGLRARNPQASEAEIDAQLAEWLRRRD
jgi:hypothetical protein